MNEHHDHAADHDEPRNIVILCDGTGNQINENISNVLKLYRCLRKTEKTKPRQLVYYDPGVGTLSQPDAWHKLKPNFNLVLGLATGYGLDDNTLAAYCFLANNWRKGDRVYLFGFSRGAYTVRVLAGLVHKIGLITPEQVNLAGSGQVAYKAFSTQAPENGIDLRTLGDTGGDEDGPQPLGEFDNAAQFARITSSRAPVIDFIGVWDTVASVIVPRWDRFPMVFTLEELAFTLQNPSVKTFRQAIAIDERRCMFRLKQWDDPQTFRSNPWMDPAKGTPQDILQVWFTGVHCDVGGGYPEKEAALSKYPLLWMIDEAKQKGLEFNTRTVNQLAWGEPRKGSPFKYVRPIRGMMHNSMNFAWRLLECVPKLAKYKEWPPRKVLFGFYIPCCEPRPIPEGAVIHASVVERMAVADIGYKPVNLPQDVHDVPNAGAAAGGDGGCVRPRVIHCRPARGDRIRQTRSPRRTGLSRSPSPPRRKRGARDATAGLRPLLQHRLEIRARPLRLGACRLGRIDETEIAVNQSLARMIFHRHAGRRQRLGIGRALVAQRIEPGGGDDGGRDTGEILRAQRRGAPVGAVRWIGEIMPAEPLHHRAGEEIALGILGARGEAGVLASCRRNCLLRR